MSNTVRKILAAALAALMLGGFTACGEQAESPVPEQPQAEPETAAETEPETEFRYRADYLPEVNYGGYTFKIFAYDEYPADQQEETGNLINDAIYQRNRLVEEQYGIVIAETRLPYARYGDVYEQLKKSALAQSDDQDLYTVVFPNAYSGINEKVIPVASSFPVIDPAQPWYCRQINDGMVIDGIMLVAYTAFDKNPGGKLIAFNKRIVTDLSLDSPYALVDEGTWTYDRFYAMGSQAAADLNGDGQRTEEDRFGIIAPIDDLTDLAYYGSGLKLVNFTEGIPEISQDERLFDVFDRMYAFMSDGVSVFNVSAAYGMSTESNNKGLLLFKSGAALFTTMWTTTLTQMGDMEDDYGVVTYPKFSEDQKSYYNGIDGSRIALPSVAAADLERTCVIKEALSVESMNINYPAYYEISLKNRYVRDEDSVRMLEIITKANYYDVGAALDYNAIRGPWLNCLQKGSTDFVSSVTKNLKVAQKAIDKLIESTDAIRAEIGG